VNPVPSLHYLPTQEDEEEEVNEGNGSDGAVKAPPKPVVSVQVTKGWSKTSAIVTSIA